jgi:Fuc2NAc and GlcNAc transferase
MMILLALLAATVTLILTASVRRYALRRALFDHPNQRSLHAFPTPRGGGLGIVLSVLGYVIYGLVVGIIDRRLGIALLGGGGVIAAVGTADDIRSLSAETRLAVHFLAAIWAVWWLGGLPAIDVGVARIQVGVAGGVAAVLLLVWATNLYNFMDGIDGLAAFEALFIAGCAGVLLMTRNATSLATVSFVVFGASLGFLYWNWEPAKIFLGDGGSGFLGFTFGTLAVWSENTRALPIIVWFILASVFFMDASITIARRLRGGMWRYAHRTHAYQRAVISGLTHSRVVMIIAGFNLVLAGLATITVFRPTLILPVAAASVGLAVIVYLIVGRMQPFVLERPPE